MILKSGGFLFQEKYNSITTQQEFIDVSSMAHIYLNDLIELDNFTLRDAYTLLEKNSILQQIFSNNFVTQYIEHFKTIPVKTYEKPLLENSLAQLQIFRRGSYNYELNRLEFMDVAEFEGCSSTLTKPYEDFPIGSKIPICLDFMDYSKFLDLPISFNPLVSCNIDAYLNHSSFSKPLLFERTEFNLFETLSAITNEIAISGEPNKNLEIKEKIINIIKEQHDNLEVHNISGDELQQMFDLNEYIKGFSFIDKSIDKDILNNVVSFLPNKIDIALFFYTFFPKKIILHSQYIGLTAYEYRHSVLNECPSLLLSQEMRQIINNNQGIKSSDYIYFDPLFYEFMASLNIHITQKDIASLLI